MADETINVQLRLRDARRYWEQLREAARWTRQFGDETERSSKKTKGLSTETNVLQKVISLVKPAALITSVGLLAQVMSAGGAGAVALVAGLVPLVGVVGTLPGLALGAAQGMGVMKLAFMGVGNAVGGLNAQMDPKKLAALTPEAQRFARTLDALKKPIIGIQRYVQGRMFGGLTDGLREARPLLGALKGPLGGTAAALGQVGRRLGVLVGSKGFLRDLASQARFTNRQIPTLATAAIHMANALRDVMVTARPLTAWMIRLAGAWASGISGATRQGRETGRLAGFFEQTRNVLSRVFSIAGAAGAAVWNILKAGRTLGNDLLRNLDLSASAFAKWTGSASGQNKIAVFFRNARGPIFEVGRLVRDVVKVFFGLGNQRGVEGLIRQLRTQLLPVVARVLNSTTHAFGPTMIAAVIAFARAFEPLAGTSGPLVLYVKIMTDLAKALLWLEQHIPGFSAALTTMVGAFAVYRVTVGLAAIVTRAWTIASTVAAVATRGFALALLFMAYSNPIGLIVVAVVALIAAFVLAYKKIGWFRHAVDAAFRFVKTAAGAVIGFLKAHWPLILAILTGPVGLATLFVVKHFRQIVNFVKGMPGKIARAASGMFNGIKNAFRDAINWIINKWNGLEISLGPVKLPGPIPDIPKITIGTPNIPLLAAGGVVRGVGSWITGEAGPELNTTLPGGGVRVQPLSGPRLAAPRMAAPRLAAGGARGGGDPIYITVISKLDGREVARSVNHRVADARARA